MSGGSTIVEFWRDRADAAEPHLKTDDILLLEQSAFDVEETEAARRDEERRVRRIRAILIVVALAWLGFAGWAFVTADGLRAQPDAWVGMIATSVMPLALLGIAYLLILRGSRSESRRYLDTARVLRTETERLEIRLARISTQLDSARAAMQDQAELLDSYGAAASSNMEASAELIASRAQATAERTEAAEKAGEALVVRMDSLIAAIPELEERTGRLAAQIMDNGHALSERIDAMETRLHALTELSDEARTRTLAATKSLSAQLNQLQQSTRGATDEVTGMADIAAGRIEATAEGARQAMATAREQVEVQSQALDALIATARRGVGETSEALRTGWAQELETAERALNERTDGALERLREVLAVADKDISGRAAALEALVAAAKTGIGSAGEQALSTLGRDLDSAEADLRTRLEITMAHVRQVMAEVGGNLTSHAASIESLISTARSGIDSSSEKAVATLTRDMAVIEGDLRDRLENALARAQHVMSLTDEGLAGQAAMLDGLIGRSRDNLDAIGRETVTDLSDAIGDVEARLHHINELMEGQKALMTGLQTGLDQAITTSEGRFADLEQDAIMRTDRLTQALRALTEETQRIDGALTTGGLTAEKLIGCAETLLVALDSSVRELDETYPAALERFDVRMERSRGLLTAATPEMERLEAISEALVGRAEEAESLLRGQGSRLTEWLESTQGGLTANRELVDRLRIALDGAHEDATRIIEGAGPLLVTTLLRVKDTADQAAERARQSLGRAISEAAQALADASGEAMEGAVAEKVTAQIEQIAQVAEEAVKAAHLASERLTRQLLTIADTSASLEKRIDEAGRAAEDRDRDHFARRSALLIESLNSTSIDVAKILSNDVTDTAWSAYLKGDRGVFTRRAVKLLDAGESREIALHYDSDAEFRDHVNRYIHDFESMLRIILSARDGNALGVAMLSSDMGKLYVALAQAIERLRQ